MTLNNDLNYQIPPPEILEWADADLPPIPLINSSGTHMIFLERQRYKALNEMYEPEMKLAGIRIHPHILTTSHCSFYTAIKLKKIGQSGFTEIHGLPEPLKIHHVRWSPDENKIALSILGLKGLALWILDIHSGKAHQITGEILNGILTNPFTWQSDSQSLIILTKTPATGNLDDPRRIIPSGPVITEGHKNPSQHRTYQDLLKDTTDEKNFANLTHGSITNVDLAGRSEFISEGIYEEIRLSPNGRYLLLTEILRPFSYHVPYFRFPHRVSVLDLTSHEEITIQKVPLQDQLPKGFMAVHPHPRTFRWRNDQPAVITYCQALDGGDPGQKVPFRDALYQWMPPFTNEPKVLLKTNNRFSHVLWSPSGYAIATDYWYDNRNSKTYLFYPDNTKIEARILFDRDVQDQYNNPGSFVTEKNIYGREVLGGTKNHAFLTGEGIRPDGIHPFLDQYDLHSGVQKRLWEAENKDELLRLSGVMNLNEKKLIIRKETSTIFPNYFYLNWDQPHQRKFLTEFKNPFKGMEEIQKTIIQYKRKDGTHLHATLYIPAENIPNQREKYPLLMWAYPEEYTDSDLAGQVTTSEHEFTFPWYGSPVFWARRGYAVMDDVSFPIIGSDTHKINETFIEQLEENATAAINAVCDQFPVDRRRVAIGGHSYGAFMTANLLTWTNLFAAGIARSGAYNRTLTPFGFQGEQRTFWEAPGVYQKMSPFQHADKMKSPLLLIHGQSDNNSGTHTIQSQRYFDALRSLGAEVRLVILPQESHHYRSRESILHILWEQDQWLEKHLSP